MHRLHGSTECSLGHTCHATFDVQLYTWHTSTRRDTSHIRAHPARDARRTYAWSAQEHGPRALGHRSLLFYPDKTDSKDRINRLKRRQWFVPPGPAWRSRQPHAPSSARYKNSVHFDRFAAAARAQAAAQCPTAQPHGRWREGAAEVQAGPRGRFGACYSDLAGIGLSRRW